MLENISQVKLHPGFHASWRWYDVQLDLYYKTNLHLPVASWRTTYGWIPLFLTEQLLSVDEILLAEDCIDIINEFIRIQDFAPKAFPHQHHNQHLYVNFGNSSIQLGY